MSVENRASTPCEGCYAVFATPGVTLWFSPAVLKKAQLGGHREDSTVGGGRAPIPPGWDPKTGTLPEWLSTWSLLASFYLLHTFFSHFSLESNERDCLMMELAECWCFLFLCECALRTPRIKAPPPIIGTKEEWIVAMFPFSKSLSHFIQCRHIHQTQSYTWESNWMLLSGWLFMSLLVYEASG